MKLTLTASCIDATRRRRQVIQIAFLIDAIGAHLCELRDGTLTVYN